MARWVWGVMAALGGGIIPAVGGGVIPATSGGVMPAIDTYNRIVSIVLIYDTL